MKNPPEIPEEAQKAHLKSSTAFWEIYSRQ
jgi:hypothetical protein